MKTNEKKSVALLNFFGCRANRIKNSFKKPSKMLFGKIGLFLVLGVMILNMGCEIDKSENNLRLFIYVKAADTADIQRVEEIGGIDVASSAAGNTEAVVKAMESDLFSLSGIINSLLVSLNGVIVKLNNFAAGLVEYILQEASYNKLIRTNTNIYVGWAAVRDILNLFFMMLLLFSAFATIFQVEKYHIRKVIIMLIVMALLVNFSFPIALFIMDFSNSAMYFLMERAFDGSLTASGELAKITNLGPVMTNVSGVNGMTKTTSLILMIIFNFIIFVTLFSIGLNLLIRMLAFVVLLIVSPAGFAFAFFPDTKSVASSWWSALFKYAFLGPIMVFFLYLAMLMFDNNTFVIREDSSFVVSTISFAIPIVFLWMGLIISQKFGGSGAGVAMNMANRTGKWVKGAAVGTAIGGAVLVGKTIDTGTGHRISGGIGGVKAKLDSYGQNYKSESEKRKTQAAEFLGVGGATEKLVQDTRKKWKDNGISDADLTKAETSGTKAEKMAAALHRAENDKFDSNPAIAATQYMNSMNAVRGHKIYEDQFVGNARKQNIDLVINEKITSSGATTPTAIKDIAKQEFAKLKPDQWKDQNIERMTSNTNPNRGYIIPVGADIISGYTPQNQAEVTKNMKGVKQTAGSAAANGSFGLWA